MTEGIDDLIDDLIRAAQGVTSAFEWGTGMVGAERELEEAHKKLTDAIERITDERDSLAVQVKRIADSLQCHPSKSLDVINSWCVKLLNPNRVPRGILRHVQEKLNSNQQIFRRGTVEPLYVYASGLQDRIDELEGKK